MIVESEGYESVTLFADEVGQKKDLLVTALKIGLQGVSEQIPEVLITNDNPNIMKSRLYSAVVQNIAEKYKNINVMFNGCIVDSARANMHLIHVVNDKPTNSCTLAANLATFRQVDTFHGQLTRGERKISIHNWNIFYNRYSKELSCPTNYDYKKVDKFIERISENIIGQERDAKACIDMFGAMRDMHKFLSFPEPLNDHVTSTTLKLIVGLEYFYDPKFTTGIVLKYTIVLAFVHIKITGGTTEVWSNFKLEELFKDLDDKDRESLIELCTEINPNFQYLTKHKNSMQPQVTERGAPQINLLSGWELDNLRDLTDYIFTVFNREGKFSCFLCNDQFSIKKKCYDHLKSKHNIKFPEFRPLQTK